MRLSEAVDTAEPIGELNVTVHSDPPRSYRLRVSGAEQTLVPDGTNMVQLGFVDDSSATEETSAAILRLFDFPGCEASFVVPHRSEVAGEAVPSFVFYMQRSFEDSFEAHYGLIAGNGNLDVRDWTMVSGDSLSFEAELTIEEAYEQDGASGSVVTVTGGVFYAGPLVLVTSD